MGIFGKLFGVRPDPEVGIELAREIVGTYGGVLGSGPVPGTVADVTELPYPKETIKTAILVLLRVTTDPAMREQLKVGYISLADWQPGVGPSRVGFDATKLNLSQSPSQLAAAVVAADDATKVWRPKVKAEQETLVKELREKGYW